MDKEQRVAPAPRDDLTPSVPRAVSGHPTPLNLNRRRRRSITGKRRTTELRPVRQDSREPQALRVVPPFLLTTLGPTFPDGRVLLYTRVSSGVVVLDCRKCPVVSGR